MKYPKNKYRKGYIIFGLTELVWHLENGHWVYLRDKVVHPSVILNMTLNTVSKFMYGNSIHEAINQKKEYSYGFYQRPLPEGIGKQPEGGMPWGRV